MIVMHDFVEDINEWVNETVLKQKQEEQLAKKHDYENVPKIVISDVSETSNQPPLRSTSMPDGRTDRNAPQKAPAPPRKRAQSSPVRLTQSDDVTACSTHNSDSTDSVNDNNNSASSLSSNTEDLVTFIRRQQIQRIYTNDAGELVIRFANPKAAELFDTCDVRNEGVETCPVNGETAVAATDSATKTVQYATVKKQAGNKQAARKSQETVTSSENNKPATPKEEPKTRVVITQEPIFV